MSIAHARLLLVPTVLLLLGGAAQGRGQDHRPGPARSAVRPALPAIDVTTYPAASRREIAEAVARAEARPDDIEAVGALAVLLHAWEQLDAASAVYARAQALAPEAVDWWYLGGLTAQRRAAHVEAVAQFSVAARLASDDPLVSLRLADARLATGDLDGAAALYEPLTGTPPCDAAAWYGLGRIHLRRGADADARRALQEALARFPDFGAAHYSMAQLQRRAGDVEGARLSLLRQARCLNCWPTPPDPWQQRVDLVRDDAATLLSRGLAQAAARGAAETAEAIRLHEAVLDDAATRGQALVNLIELYGRTGNTEAVTRRYQEALEVPGFAADAHKAYGMVLLTLQRPGEALPALDRAAALTPRDPAVQVGRGLALEILDRLDEATAAYRAALDAAPTTSAARFGLARIAMRRQAVDEAIGHLERLRASRDADSPRHLFALSSAYARRGRLAEARRVAEEARDLARALGDEQLAAHIESELRKLEPHP